jgi:hypothetical protein
VEEQVTIWSIISILGISLSVVIFAVAIDVLRDYIPKKMTERQIRKEEEARHNEWALRMLTVAGLHKNAHAIYRREQGTHRRVRV